MTKEDAVEKFAKSWKEASALSPNLTWAIFPVGDQEIEFKTAQHLLDMFTNLPGILYMKPGTDPADAITWAKAIQKHYEEKLQTKLATAADKSDFQLHLGS